MPGYRPDTERLRAEVAALIEEHHLPGVAIGVVSGGELVHAEGFGWADIALKRPMAPEMRHRVASVTKTMISLCVMALADEGRLSLDSRVAELLPDFRFHGPAEQVTVRHLLTHTAGIGEAPMPDDMRQPFAYLFRESDPAIPLAELYEAGITIEVPPGTKWAYANHGFALLGEIVSRLDGAPLAEVLEARVFGPLGMESSDLADQPHPELSHGYQQALTPEARQLIDLMGVQLESDEPVDGYNLPGKYVRVWGNGGAGAVQSTVPDMARYAIALLRGGGGIVRPETLALMTRPHWQPDPRLPGWGLGFSVRTVHGHRMFGHGGAAFGGWNTHLGVFPDLDAALIVFTNIMHDLFDGVFVPRLVNAFLGVEEAAIDVVAPDPLVLETAPGVYELPMPGPLTNFRPLFNCGRVQVTASDGGLVLQSRRGPWKDGARLLPLDPSQPDFFCVEPKGYARNYVVALRDSEGRVTGLRFQQLVDMYKNPELQPWT